MACFISGRAFCADLRTKSSRPSTPSISSRSLKTSTNPLWADTSRSKSAHSRISATRLTQQHRREAKGRPRLRSVKVPRPDAVCRGCGKQIHRGAHFCSTCAVTATRKNFDVGRKRAQSPEHLAKRAATMRRHKQAIQNWNPSDLPALLTRDVYVKQIQPALASVAKSQIRLMLGVSELYSSAIRAGRIPHPRHWLALAQLANVCVLSARLRSREFV
jgi:hypothetical protein